MALQYDRGSYYGGAEGAATTSLSVSTAGHVGCTALFIVMHRDTITLPQSWQYITSVHGGWSNAVGYYQDVTIAKKVVTSSAEQFAVTQASSARMAANVWYFSEDVGVSLIDTLSMDTGSSTYQYTVPAKDGDYLELDIINNIYCADAIWFLNPTQLICGPLDIIYGSSADVRLYSMINTSTGQVQTGANTSVSDDSRATNRLHRFRIVTSGGGGSAVVEQLTATANGTYTAPSGVDGYSPVIVNVNVQPTPGYDETSFLQGITVGRAMKGVSVLSGGTPQPVPDERPIHFVMLPPVFHIIPLTEVIHTTVWEVT